MKADTESEGFGMSEERANGEYLSTDLLSPACDIIRRLVDKVNVDNEYDEHQCPNGQPCGVCKLVAEAKAFIAANDQVEF